MSSSHTTTPANPPAGEDGLLSRSKKDKEACLSLSLAQSWIHHHCLHLAD